MWKRIGIRGDGSPQQPAGKVQASPLSTSREKYARKLPLNEESLHKRDLSSSRISEHSGRLIKMVERLLIIDVGIVGRTRRAEEQRRFKKLTLITGGQ